MNPLRIRHRAFGAAVLVLTCPGLLGVKPDEELALPFRVQAGGKPISAMMGHAAVCSVDLDGDDLEDLLVGEFFSTRLRLYRNRGTDRSPSFAKGTYVESDGKRLSVPGG